MPGMSIDYKWLAESIAMTGSTITADLLVALDHAANVPGKQLTPARVDRLVRLAKALDETRPRQ